MPRFEFETSIALASCTVASAALFLYNRPREEKIKLPIHGDEALEESASENTISNTSDPFDVVTQEDFIEGYPVEEETFWTQVKRRKFGLCFLTATIVVLQCIQLGLYVENGAGNNMKLVAHSLNVYFAIYLLALCLQSIYRCTVERHSESVLHITVLTTIPALLLTTLSLLPETPLSQVNLQRVSPIGDHDNLWYIMVVLYLSACILAFTTPQGPPLYYPPSAIYLPKAVESITNKDKENVTGLAACSPWGYLMFSYTTKVVMLGNIAESLEIGDLPILPANMRCVVNFTQIRKMAGTLRLRFGTWAAKTGSGWNVAYQLVRLNIASLTVQFWIAVFSAMLFYLPPYFLNLLILYLESDPERRDRSWGWLYAFGLIMSNVIVYLLTAQLWSISTTVIQTRFRIQLNSILYAKTLVRKDAISSSASVQKENETAEEKQDEDDFSTKAQIMTLMTTDTDRVSEFAWHFFTLVDSPIELIIGTLFVYKLLGVSALYGLLVIVLSMPMNHLAGKVVVDAQENLMKARDERIALMNEVLGGIRMLKFMAWERSFESRILKIRDRELKYQKLNYNIETLWNGIWNATPVLVTVVAFFHFTVIRGQQLTPNIAFTAITVFNELKFALNALPETLINALQGFVSLRRIEKYLNTAEVDSVPPLDQQSQTIAFQSCTITWPQDRAQRSAAPSAVSTPRQKFVLLDLSLKFPTNGFSLVCGKLGSGKTLLLLALLGEADILAGQVVCPRSPPNAIASYIDMQSGEKWIVQGLCAYVPQMAWLRNASIKDNILFNLPYDEARYQKTLEVCALITDMDILEDGDESEIGERGVNLSGGQKARVSLARAVYSRASILFLDDVLSAVDAHTAHHLYYECLKGELMKDRTVILVSHHVQLCAPGVDYIVALDNGRVQFTGDYTAFQRSGVIRTLVQSTVDDKADGDDEQAVEATLEKKDCSGPGSDSATFVNASTQSKVKKTVRKLVEEETRAIGRVRKDVWATYLEACGRYGYWFLFMIVFVVAALSPVAENGWLKIWSGAVLGEDGEQGSDRGPLFYVGIYAAVTLIGLVLTTIRWFVLYRGSINASVVLYKRLLEAVLFADVRFHDTVSRGRLLNRFGKDFEGIDSSLSDNFGRTVTYGLSSVTTLVTVAIVGGFPFVIAAAVLGLLYYNVGKFYGQTSRDMRRLDSVTRSPIYSIYGETIAGVTILRAFGASSKFLRDMLRCLDTNVNPYYWMWGVNRWLSVRFNLLSCGIVGAMAVVAVWNPGLSASIAGFSLAFASTITGDLLFMVRRFVGLEQSMVALERVKEYSELKREAPEFVEPRPPASWPTKGEIRCENLVIRYAPELPDVLHRLNFEIKPGEKVGILGRTGSGKSTLALSFFRFVEATEGRILVDDIDIAKIGLTDLRSRSTIIPQDPTILSGTLRSTLDVFNEYEDAEIFEALRRVHLIPSSHEIEEEDQEVNANIFRNLDSSVSEGGDNFSTGEKQLLCMARAILKRSKVLVMDEATASVDYSTDELISQTIRQEFADSTILTIAHRLRTVIDYDRIMLLDQGRIVEFDRPQKLLAQPSSKFYALCKATGKDEFATLKKLAGV